MTMDFKAYQKIAHETAIYPTDITLNIETSPYKNESCKFNFDLRWIYPALGLSAETGELMNVLKKVIRDDNGELTTEKLIKIMDELGDILWYVAETATQLNLDLDVIALRNTAKLSERARQNKIKGSGDKR